MKVHKLEKRADGVIRWLERMKRAYSSGAVESAYMDAECARADLEDLRIEFLRPKVSNKGGGFLLTISRSMFLAVMIVMVTVMPLSRDNMVVIEPEVVKEDPSVLSGHLPLAEEAKTPHVKWRGGDVSAKSRAKTTALKRAVQPTVTAPVKSVTKPKVSAPTKTVAYDKVYSLVQTGQRALKNDKSVIKVKGD